MKIKKMLFISLSVLLAISMASCGETISNSNVPTSSTEETTIHETTSDPTTSIASDYVVKITAIGSTEIQKGNTVQLRASVTGTTQKDVTWSTTNKDVATVSDKGLVSGINAGTAEIFATLNLDPNSKASIKITVTKGQAPDTITITGSSSGIGWVDEDIQLKAEISPETASKSVIWSTNNKDVATITADGLVSFLKVGSVSVLATSEISQDVYGQIDFDVKYGAFLSNKGSTNWDLTHQSDATDPYILLSNENDDISKGYNSAFFAHYKGQKYYVEATIQNLGATSNAWAWQGFGLGSGLSDNDARFFNFSPMYAGQGNTHNKFILRERPDNWGGLTDRSQTWGEHGINSIDTTAPIKFGMLRDGNNYYYLMNDVLYYFDYNENYAGIDTFPMIVCQDMPVKVTKYSIVSDSAKIDTMINSDELKKSFFAAYDNVTYNSNADMYFNSITTLNKDHKVKFIGDKGKLVRNFTIEADVSDLAFNSEKSCFTGLTINLTRYDAANYVETFAIGKSVNQANDGALISRFCSWDYTQSMEYTSSISNWFETSSTVKTDAATLSYIKITRTIVDSKAVFKMFVDNKECSFNVSKGGANESGVIGSTYTGAYLLWIGGEYSSSHVQNVVFSSND